ncbi:hypothetical protein XH83_27245 [Bradyrhizobium sp. CCBAU 53351]|uniref:RNA polymerase sigma factor region1.1 domain-containing protein n=1 Tax=Bradyrhizobium sp. CCBAU 53351 TaxID=1325114 RepID=UPI001888D033|nr:RNA polymerase sigma factor region1.1 domain-containing protein [Bradyrhizobium sp. CCBAU 53351]QOZ78782.1 hypothetical protein XH83_27245 [Bradyrhizobium sp. CCBAU 53351]
MAPSVSYVGLPRLVALGRRKGFVTDKDLKAVLPVGEMTEEQVASVVSRLEELGLPVELDPPFEPARSLHEPMPPDLDNATALANMPAQGGPAPAHHSLAGSPIVPDLATDWQANIAVILAGAVSCGAFMVAAAAWNW